MCELSSYSYESERLHNKKSRMQSLCIMCADKSTWIFRKYRPHVYRRHPAPLFAFTNEIWISNIRHTKTNAIPKAPTVVIPVGDTNRDTCHPQNMSVSQLIAGQLHLTNRPTGHGPHPPDAWEYRVVHHITVLRQSPERLDKKTATG